MGKKIIRGAFIGGFLGIVLGMLISYTVHFYGKGKTIDPVNLVESAYVSVFNDEGVISPDSAYGGGSLNFNPPECNDLEDVILRFHVKANSNSEEDIALKYMVRDAVLTHIGGELDGNVTRDEILSYIRLHLDEISELARETITKAGYDYDVNAYISNDFFPIRQYGDMVIPAGNYQALRIDIGDADGENFWCILYPMMCYTVDCGAVVSKSDEKKLESELSEEDYKRLFVDHDTGDNEVKIKFKFLEWLGF